MEEKKLALLALSVCALFLFGCAALSPQDNYYPSPPSGNLSPQPPAKVENNSQLANPFATNCISKGYKYEMRKGTAGEEGYCIFPSGRECEAWAYFRGECADSAGQKLGKEGEFCGGIAALPCDSGLDCVLEGNYPDAGGKCRKKSEFKKCPSDRLISCPVASEPVCGRSGETESLYDYEDYANPCVACSMSSPANGYFAGSCPGNNLVSKAKDPAVLYACPETRFEVCTKEYDPVCGRLVGTTTDVAGYRDYPNPCVACSKDNNAIGYYVGTCAGKKA